jgi:hypothetical protein
LSVIADILKSFGALPLWVLAWAGLVLLPANLASLLFLAAPQGVLIACLAVGGMAANLPILFRQRGVSKATSIPHVLFWTPLVVVLVAGIRSGEGSSVFLAFALVLAAVDTVSLGFDYLDAWKWYRGERAVAGAKVSASGGA